MHPRIPRGDFARCIRGWCSERNHPWVSEDGLDDPESENNFLSRDTQLRGVTRNCQIYSMQLDTLKSGFF